MPSIGVVIPAYKEQDNLVRLCEAITKELPSVRIVIVDDSPDMASVEAVQQRQLPNVEIDHRTSKAGRGSAVLFGLSKLAQHHLTYYIEIDADFSHPPTELPAMIEQAERESLDLLIGSRYTKESRIVNWPLARRLFSKLANILAKTLLRVPITDYTNGYRLYTHRAVEEILRSCGQRGAGFIALSEILVCLYYQGFKVGERPTVFTNRLRGESSVSRKEVWDSLVGLVNIYRYKRSLQR